MTNAPALAGHPITKSTLDTALDPWAMTLPVGGRAGLRGDIRGGLFRVERSGVRLAGLVVSFPRSRLTFDGTVEPHNHAMKVALQVHADPLDLDDFLDRLQPVRAILTRRSDGGRGGARKKSHWPDVG